MATVETAQDEAARRLLARAEREAERVAALVRIVIALVLLVLVQIILWDHMPKGGPARSSETTLLLVEDGRLFLVALLALGALAYVAVRRDWGGRWRPYVTATADAALILGNLHHSLTVAGLTGGLLLAMPTVFLIPLVLAGIAVHYRPWLQLFATALYAAGLLALALLHGAGSMEERMAALQNAIYMFAGPPNAVRLIMLLLIGALLVLAAIRGRTLLRRAVDETVRRGSFARFLPGEISRLVGTPQADSLRAGRRQIATVVFVDIRDSTGRAEALDPRALSVFVSAFRRRVLAAANENDGIVDKFIGDGALVVFGVPEPSPEDAARALAFGADLLRRIERWNDKRGFMPPLRIGIGIHTGEVYCGLVGDESRLEFTVLGDAVNVAARLEEATKTHRVPILASAATIEAARAADWRELGNELLRGRAQAMRIMTPAG